MKTELAAREMLIECVTVRRHESLYGDYRVLEMDAPRIAPRVEPGQFIHLLVPGLPEGVLRRPFSVFKTEGDRLSILYKPVGRGTRAMLKMTVGEPTSIIGPLGNGFPVERAVQHPVLVAGGYGMAALYMVAVALESKGVIFMGGRSSGDILCVDQFEALDWNVQIATEDGSMGQTGLVTDVLDEYMGRIDEADADGIEYFACGPNPMLKAVSDRALRARRKAWLSLDRNMGCGVGACLVCVQKIRRADHSNGAWHWERVCTEGPVFESREIVWDSDE